MVGADVDQKYLGIFAKDTAETRPELSAALYKILGLSTLLYRKIVRARKQRKLDPTRPTKSLDLYKHILWMAREGHVILDTQVIPHVDEFAELKVLAYKLKASFLHIFVLFDQSYNAKSLMTGSPLPPSSPPEKEKEKDKIQPNTLYPLSYVSPTMDAFIKADDLATRLLPGIHPLRLSVKLEYSAFTYDCTKDQAASRRLAMQGIDEALEAMHASTEEDEMFEEASRLIGCLAVMSQRGLSPKPNKHSPKMGQQDHLNEQRENLPPSISPTPVSYGKSLTVQ